MTTNSIACASDVHNLNDKIANRAAADAWLNSLVDSGLYFHLESEPSEIVNDSCERFFTDEEAELISQRVDELYELDWSDSDGCPIGYMLDRIQTVITTEQRNLNT
ncbi:MAG: hypothetical protein ACPGGD_03155 [Thalassolituus sp.]